VEKENNVTRRKEIKKSTTDEERDVDTFSFEKHKSTTWNTAMEGG
jgi:hypothetical protein